MLKPDKSGQILAACSARDLDALVELATSEGGLLNDSLRQNACVSWNSALTLQLC